MLAEPKLCAKSEGCDRCEKFEEKVLSRGPDASEPAEEFYCDVGMKAVLRQIRKHLISWMRLPLAKINNIGQSLLFETCLKFAKRHILRDEDRALSMSSIASDHYIVAIMLNLLDFPG